MSKSEEISDILHSNPKALGHHQNRVTARHNFGVANGEHDALQLWRINRENKKILNKRQKMCDTPHKQARLDEAQSTSKFIQQRKNGQKVIAQLIRSVPITRNPGTDNLNKPVNKKTEL